MTGKNLKYLLGILNSKLSKWYFSNISVTTGQGTILWKKYKLELLPISETKNQWFDGRRDCCGGGEDKVAKKELTLEEIHSIDHDALAVLVYGQADKDAVFRMKVEKLILKGDQKALIQSIQKDIASIRRGRKFISYYEAFDFAQKIGSIVDDIAMMVEDKKEAAGFLKALILTGSKVYLRSDDSAGAIQASYSRAEEGWAECLEVLTDAETYADIMEMLVCEGFGVRSVFSEKVPQSVLQKIYDDSFERCETKQGEASTSFDDIHVMQLCAHYLKKPELYIKAAKLGKGN